MIRKFTVPYYGNDHREWEFIEMWWSDADYMESDDGLLQEAAQ